MERAAGDESEEEEGNLLRLWEMSETEEEDVRCK